MGIRKLIAVVAVALGLPAWSFEEAAGRGGRGGGGGGPVGDNKETTYEAGFANLTKPETTMLVHFGKDRTQQWTLVRVDQPAEKK
ncbi:hypothetical protein AYO44_04385 [Planctomycetaceae bacterium SCGC AG-212-F19]|nr:hypothetical protein AYO44_04385 [Planctomycetaceae bacterium SCGC AG-212-F19]